MLLMDARFRHGFGNVVTGYCLFASRWAGGAVAGGRGTTDAFDEGEDKDFAKPDLRGPITNERRFGRAVIEYDLSAITLGFDECVNKDCDKPTLRGTTNGRDFASAVDGYDPSFDAPSVEDKPSTETLTRGDERHPCGSEGAIHEAYRASLRWRRADIGKLVPTVICDSLRQNCNAKSVHTS